MQNDLVKVAIKGVMPTPNGCAVFLNCKEKTFVIYIDQGIANIISMAINKVKKERPLTHDLINNIFKGLDVTLERIVINAVKDGIFFARIILTMNNELGTKILEVDARPSDSMVLALQSKRPIYVTRQVLDEVEDMTEILERLLKGSGD